MRKSTAGRISALILSVTMLLMMLPVTVMAGTLGDVSYTVTFNANGHGTAPADKVVKSGDKATEPTPPSAEGYFFEGWYKEKACANAWEFDTDTVTSDTTLYAKWSTLIDPPTAATGLTYNGEEQTGVLEGTGYIFTDTYYIDSHDKAVDAGPYTALAVLKDGYRWQDGSTDNKYIDWSIEPADIRTASIANIPDQKYTGSGINPEPEVTLGTKKLVKGKDYKYSYSNNMEPGNATVTVSGKGNYKGSANASFRICKETELTVDTAGSILSVERAEGVNAIVKIKLTDTAAEKYPIAGGTVKVYKGETEIGSGKTNLLGCAEINIASTSLEKGANNLTAKYEKTAEYEPCSVNVTITVSADVEETVAKMNAIGEVAYTAESKAKIDAARAAYEALTDDKKALVTAVQLKVLTDAEARYEELKAAEDMAPVDAVIDSIDAIGEAEYTDKDLIDERAKYIILKPGEGGWEVGRNITWTRESNTSLTFRGTGELTKFSSASIDSITVPNRNYLVYEGSTIICFKASYLETLSAGKHTLEMVWNDGTATVTFTVQEKQQTTEPASSDNVPKTGDHSNMALWIVLLIVSAAGITGTAIYGKRKKYSK